jgi:hypothetical protein
VQPGFGSTRPWFAVGAIGTVRFTPVAWSYVELFGGAKLPLVRDRFYFEPSGSTVFEASPVGGTLGATLGFRVM